MENPQLIEQQLCLLPTDIQMNYNGHFLITISESNNQSRKFIENNKDRNWNERQIQKFAAFLYYHHEKLKTIDARKANKIFKLLSHYVQSRNINQCRTFTIKMIKKFGNLASLNSFFEQSLPCYQEIIKRQKPKLQNIKISLPETKQFLSSSLRTPPNQFQKKGQIPNNSGQQKKHLQLKPTDTEYHIQQKNTLQKDHQFYRNQKDLPVRSMLIFQDMPSIMEKSCAKGQNGTTKGDQASEGIGKSKKIVIDFQHAVHEGPSRS